MAIWGKDEACLYFIYDKYGYIIEYVTWPEQQVKLLPIVNVAVDKIFLQTGERGDHKFVLQNSYNIRSLCNHFLDHFEHLTKIHNLQK